MVQAAFETEGNLAISVSGNKSRQLLVWEYDLDPIYVAYSVDIEADALPLSKRECLSIAMRKGYRANVELTGGLSLIL